MPKLSAGILAYRQKDESIDVFLVHPGGPFYIKKDNGVWSLPKGEYSDNEDALNAAKREFKEETGHDAPAGEYLVLGEVRYGNKKLVAWAVEGDLDPENIVSNEFELEWPPKSGIKQKFPEADRAGWFGPAAAKQKLVSGQAEYVDRLLEKLNIDFEEKTTVETPTQPSLF